MHAFIKILLLNYRKFLIYLKLDLYITKLIISMQDYFIFDFSIDYP